MFYLKVGSSTENSYICHVSSELRMFNFRGSLLYCHVLLSNTMQRYGKMVKTTKFYCQN